MIVDDIRYDCKPCYREPSKIRWFRPKDLHGLCELYQQAYPQEDWQTGDFFRFVENPERTNILKVFANDSGRVHGSLMYTIDKHVCKIRRLCVWPGDHRRGIGEYIMRTAVIGDQRHRPLRCEQFITRVQEDNLPGIMFLKKLAFVFDPAEPRDKHGNGNDWYSFCLVTPSVGGER